MRVALVPLYVDYYESVVPGIEARKRRLIAQATEAIGAGAALTVFDPVRSVAEAEGARRVLRDASCEALIVLPLVAAFSEISDALVRGWTQPLLLLSAMAGRRVPAGLTMRQVVAESQAFGAQAIANGWMRQGLSFDVLHVEPGRPDGAARIRQWLALHGAIARLPRLRMGLIGGAFAGMTDVQLPARAFRRATGATIVDIPMSRCHAEMRAASAAHLRALEARLRTQFHWGPCSAREQDRSLRAAHALLRIVEEERLDCAAFNSHGPEGLKHDALGVMAALGVTLATTGGCPMAEVGDLCTAFAMWLGRALSGASYYTELDAAYVSADEWLLLNSGEFDLAWTRRGHRPRLVRNTNFAGVNGRGLSVQAPLRTGPATLINFTPRPDGVRLAPPSSPRSRRPARSAARGAIPLHAGYRLQFCEGTIASAWRETLGVGTALLRVPEAPRLYERWLAAGPVHHSCLAPGHLGPAVSTFCARLGWEALEIR